MNMKRFWGLILFLTIFSTKAVFPIADWTVLIYVQAKNNLSRFATQNLHSMAKVGSNKNLNILVQWYQPGKEGIWRYKVLKNKIKLDSHLNVASDGTNVKDLVDSMDWAVKKYPAKHTFFILWNHGTGIVDPAWQRNMNFAPLGRAVNIEKLIIEDQNMNKEEVDLDIDPALPIRIDEELAQKLGLSNDFDFSYFNHKGILFNEYSRTYLTNEELAEALKQIKTKVLHNKKIDIFGMDACLMSMVEVGYLVKDSAKYMVSSQESELAYGWNYLDLFGSIQTGRTTPLELAKGSVMTYEKFYNKRINFYTQSAVDLDTMDVLRDSINGIVLAVNECKKYDVNLIKNLIKTSRKASTQFTNRSYIDLHSFYFNLSHKISTRIGTIRNNLLKKSLNQLKEMLNLGMNLINSTVVAKVAGTKFPRAHGLSIYFPLGRVDKSYYRTSFVRDSLWLDLVKSIH